MFEDESRGLFLFYGWWQMGVCLFAFFALLAIWWHIGKKRNDFGQVWLAISILCWAISGFVEVLYAYQFVNSLTIEIARSSLSLSNSLFILLALPWFRYLPEKLKGLIKSKHWHFMIGIPFLFCLLPTISKILWSQKEVFVQELDVYYAFFTLAFLAAVLWTTFQKRRLKSLAYLSLLCLAITLFAQVNKLLGSTTNVILFSAIFKTNLIMIFFALALSWVKELSENIIPHFSSLRLRFDNDHDYNEQKKEVSLLGIPNIGQRPIELSLANYQLLRKFAIKRKFEKDPWLEIKPKEGRNRDFDIKDHNEIKRLISSLLDGLFGSNSWSKEQHFDPLKSALLELSDKRERKIRLRLHPDQISINKSDSP